MKDLKKRINKSSHRTQELFAAAVGIDEALISKYCRGIRQPSEKHLVIIKKALKIK